MKKGRFNIGFKVSPEKKGIWQHTINMQVPRIVHDDVAGYAKKHNILLREALVELIGLGLASVEGWEIEGKLQDGD